MIDHAKVMHISRPAEVVIVGNPGIADATIQDQQTLIITGRSFGSTNLIVLDASGKAIAEETLSVVAVQRQHRDGVPDGRQTHRAADLQLHARLLTGADHRRRRQIVHHPSTPRSSRAAIFRRVRLRNRTHG